MNPAPVIIPVIPDNAPFTAEQRAYLNGFLAGILSRATLPGGQPASSPTSALTPVTILFGSQTGTAEGLSKRLAKEAGKRGFAPTTHDLASYPTAQLPSERHVLLVTSTYGDGEPPDNAKPFWEFLSRDAAPKLSGLNFSICALGDTNYPKFCAFGKAVEERMVALGARAISPRTECDVDYEEPFAKWMNDALAALGGASATGTVANNDQPAVITGARMFASLETDSSTTAYSRTNPFPAPLVTNRHLNAPNSAKDTRHFEFSLAGSGLNYEAGDALGVLPMNSPELVGEIIGALGGRATHSVPGRDDRPVPLSEALLSHYDITKLSPSFLRALATRSGDPELLRLSAPDVNGELTRFLWGREIIDLLLAFPDMQFAPEEFVKLLKKLQPRLYSISSSPKAHPGQVHLTTAVVRYQSFGRARQGVCSTYLAERVEPGTPVPVFVHSNKAFRPPANPDTPMIMVGPGTGIAPFRAFLEDRRATGARGKNWLFFGDQHAATDFLYRDELEAAHHDGLLTRLDTAFSRDQPEKVYVQTRMLNHARELFSWLEDGAHFYVCGDAARMARDVDATLHEVIMQAGGKTAGEAADYMKSLQAAKRYQRDVY